tara:strand:+ start:5081 stop:5908 length:828 start_codon:yes stop_codon:yes gene_type:complete
MGKKFCLTLDKNVLDFCKLNDIEDIRGFVIKCFERGLTIERYGETPLLMPKEKETIVKEVIKEVVKEVEIPIEVIKEVIIEVPVDRIVEKIVEKPVEVIREVIKEVPIDKIVEVDKEIVIYKERPVEVIKEVEKIVEKEVIKEIYITDDDNVKKLSDEITKLKSKNKDLSQKLINFVNEPPKIVEREVPIEVIREVEVEKVVEKPIEVIKEVIKEIKVEVPVEKIVKVRDETEIKRLTKENEELVDSLSKYDEMFNNFEKKISLKKPKRDNLYDE